MLALGRTLIPSVMPYREEDGAAAVEFALLLPLLVLLLFGIIQFGIAFNARIQATNAAREAARTAVIGIDNWADLGGGVSFWNVVESKAGLGNLTNCSLTTDNVVGGNLTVSFDFPTHLVIPFMPNPPAWQTGTARASMRIEQISAAGGPGGC